MYIQYKSTEVLFSGEAYSVEAFAHQSSSSVLIEVLSSKVWSDLLLRCTKYTPTTHWPRGQTCLLACAYYEFITLTVFAGHNLSPGWLLRANPLHFHICQVVNASPIELRSLELPSPHLSHQFPCTHICLHLTSDLSLPFLSRLTPFHWRRSLFAYLRMISSWVRQLIFCLDARLWWRLAPTLYLPPAALATTSTLGVSNDHNKRQAMTDATDGLGGDCLLPMPVKEGRTL